MLDETAKGVFTIAVTPFLPDGALGPCQHRQHWSISTRTRARRALTILGMMGEAGKLSAEESVEVVTRVTARASVPVVRGRLRAGARRHRHARENPRWTRARRA